MSAAGSGLSAASIGSYEPVIGIEVHIELATRTKMFCRCRNSPFELPPNTAICPTCIGLPGALPVVNRQAILLGLRAALVLDCQVADLCFFERKNYPYPDLVKGYCLRHRWE
jgi:aspartyl-tRNA(Asn)/glutamyl-tRNA(Gln) amidotransferase subunit B